MEIFLFLYALIGLITSWIIGMYLILRFYEDELSNAFLIGSILFAMAFWPIALLIWLILVMILPDVNQVDDYTHYHQHHNDKNHN